MKNQVYTGTPTSPRFALCPSTVKAGDAVLLGSVPAVALNDYQSNTGGSTFYTTGSFGLTVRGSSTHSPITGAAINLGDKIYASGSLDSTTNVTTGLWLSADSSDAFFGFLDPSGVKIASGATDTNAIVSIGDN